MRLVAFAVLLIGLVIRLYDVQPECSAGLEYYSSVRILK